VEAVRMLLARGSSSEARDAQGRLPVEHALRGLSGQAALGECHAECHALLLQHMARWLAALLSGFLYFSRYDTISWRRDFDGNAVSATFLTSSLIFSYLLPITKRMRRGRN
jgi:hypothetical protein